MKKFFFDTYALYETFYGNQNYKRYLDCEVITTKLNLMELYYLLIREETVEIAEKYYNELVGCAVDFSDDDIKHGMSFRLEMKLKKKNLSYVDALGYIIAKKNKIKFLTGDNEFKNLENVEFVK